MADDVCQQIENALNTIVYVTEQSGNLKKDLKHSIHETVSKLKKLVFILKSNWLEKQKKVTKREMRLNH